MATSPLQLAANRRNAQLSTGPTTETGKKKASLNALRHGLTAQIVVLPGEDLAQYIKFASDFVQDLRPEGILETQLAQTLADYQWRLNRFRALEASLFALGHEQNAPKLNVGDGPHAAEMQTALAAAQSLRDNIDTLKILSIYELRLNRQFQNTLNQLRETQALRQQQLKEELAQATQIRNLHKQRGRNFNPAEFGFVSTNTQLETALRRKDALAGKLPPQKVTLAIAS